MSECEWYEQSSHPNVFAIFGENCYRYWYSNEREGLRAQDFKFCPFCGENIKFELNNKDNDT